MTFEEVGERAQKVRAIPIEEVLVVTGAEKDRHDKAKWHTEKGVISVTGMKFMNWNEGGGGNGGGGNGGGGNGGGGNGGGGAIDLVIHLKRLSFRDAVEWLWHRFPGACAVALNRAPAHPRPNLKLPAQDPGKLLRVKHYLTHDRAIAPTVIEPLIESGRLYADNRGNAVFVLLGKENAPVGAELRGTTHRPWRGMAPGSEKNLGYFDLPPSHSAIVILCESAIDAISCFALHHRYHCISTSGARSNPRWLTPLIRQGYQVYCGFDSDPTGEKIAQAMIALHPKVKRLRPSLHDWNDILKSHS